MKDLSTKEVLLFDGVLVVLLCLAAFPALMIYGLNYCDIENRIAAARAYQSEPGVMFEADIIQITENPYSDTTTVCGAWANAFYLNHKTPAPCIEYTTRDGYIYGPGRHVA